MDEHTTGFMSGAVTVLLAIIGVGSLAVVLSRNSNTAAIVQNVGSAVGSAMSVAESPVTGATTSANLSYANTSGYGIGVGSAF